MDTNDQKQRTDIAQFPLKHPDMQIGKPVQTTLPDLPKESEFARNTQTWD